MTTYEWGNKFLHTEGSGPSGSTKLNSYDVDPDHIGDVIEHIAERDGVATPASLLDSGRSPNAPHHDCFEWDDAIASESYRMAQAGLILRTITVTIVAPEGEAETSRGFVSVIDPSDPDSQKKGYIPVLKATGDEANYVVRQAALDVDAAVKKLGAHKEFVEDVSKLRQVHASILKKMEPRQLVTA